MKVERYLVIHSAKDAEEGVVSVGYSSELGDLEALKCARITARHTRGRLFRCWDNGTEEEMDC